MGCLYQIEFPNGKKYIGISRKTSAERFITHTHDALKSTQLIHKAIRKYGKDSCIVRTLVIADDWKYLQELEIRAIKKFKTNPPFGYNLTKGGEGVSDYSGAIIAKMKKTMSGAKYKKKHKEIVRLASIAKGMPEYKAIKRQQALDQWNKLSEEERQKKLENLRKGINKNSQKGL